jgi:hypothetical protein
MSINDGSSGPMDRVHTDKAVCKAASSGFSRTLTNFLAKFKACTREDSSWRIDGDNAFIEEISWIRDEATSESHLDAILIFLYKWTV